MSTLPSTPFDILISWQTEPLAFQPPSISVYENLFKAADQEITSQPDTPSCILNSGYIPYSCSEPMMNYLTTQQDGPYFDHLNGNISHCESDDDSIISPYAYSPRMSISDDNQQVLTPDVFMPVFDFDPIVLQYAKSYEEVPSSCKVAKPDFVPLTRSNLISAQENYLSQQELKQTPIGGQGSKNKKTSRNNNKNTVTKCPYEGCQRTFQRTHNFRTHMRIHIHPKPYNCSHCERSFSRRHDLERHVRVHTGDRPYSCPCCARSFARTDALRRHLKMEEVCRQSPQVQSLKNKRRYADL
jgi:hypothetical protein